MKPDTSVQWWIRSLASGLLSSSSLIELTIVPSEATQSFIHTLKMFGQLAMEHTFEGSLDRRRKGAGEQAWRPLLGAASFLKTRYPHVSLEQSVGVGRPQDIRLALRPS